MISHQEEIALGDRPGRLLEWRGRRLGFAVLLEEIGLVEGDLIDVHQAVIADLDDVTRLTDDPLDERRVRFAPVLGRLEDDDVAAVVRVEAGRQLVHEDVLIGLERALHRLLLDLVRLRDEVLDDEEDEERQDERLDDLEKTPECGSLTHKSGSIGGRREIAASGGVGGSAPSLTHLGVRSRACSPPPCQRPLSRGARQFWRPGQQGPMRRPPTPRRACISAGVGEFDPSFGALLHSPAA